MQQELESYLADHPFLRGLDAAQLDVIADCARFVEFPAGACLFRAGEPARDCFLIRRGHVGVEINDVRQGPVVLQTLGEPSVLGWSWMVPPYRWCFDARALEAVEAIALDGMCLLSQCENDHDFGYELMKRFTAVFAQRLHATRVELMEAYANRP
jgi:CRP/FNR family cyclic AMP-dependent transcriptional regulator